MAAAPQYASCIFVGLRSKQAYSIDVYLSDVDGALVRWDSGSGASATSDSFWNPPEPVVLTDFAINTGMTDTTVIQLTRNGVPTGSMLRYANHLNSLNNRPRLVTGFVPGVRIGAIQRS